MAASTSINSYFRSRINQFLTNTLQRLWRSNPFRSLVPTREYNGADGENPTIIQYTHELPTSYPINVASHTSGTMGMETVKVSPYPDPSGETVPGGTAPSTDPTEGGAPGNHRETPTSPETDTGVNIPGVDGPLSHTIKRGQTERTFEIRQTSFNSSVATVNIGSEHFCLGLVDPDHPSGDVPGGNDADETALLKNRQVAAALFSNEGHGLLNRGIRGQGDDITGHHRGD